MKKNIFLCLMATSIFSLASCGTSKNVPTITPEESGMNMVKITNEESNTVLIGDIYCALPKNFASSYYGMNKKSGVAWLTTKVLDVSPDGEYIAFMSAINHKQNIMTHRSTTGGSSAPRTFTNINSLCWGFDGNLYYGDLNERSDRGQISSVHAQAGKAVRKLTSGFDDHDPAITRDGKKMFFCRVEGNSTIYAQDLTGSALEVIGRGYNPAVVGKSKDTFVCVRNSNAGNSEIWRINYKMGREECILSDENRSYTNPCVSADGKWIVCQGNSISSINRKKNLDIFVVRIDGSDLMQLTYHQTDDFCPVWSPDGRTIYFISGRGNEKGRYNVWSMRFTGM